MLTIAILARHRASCAKWYDCNIVAWPCRSFVQCSETLFSGCGKCS